ncbi:MAG: HAD hydrolase-like protein [Pseudomonadota bacterium]
MAGILRAMARKRSIFLDLDGTLTDPYQGIRRSIEYALESLGERWPADENFRWCIGPPLKESFALLVGRERADDALTHYRQRFANVGWRENQPYTNIHTVLDTLKQDGHTLYVATSKPQIYANRILKHFDLSRFFRAVHGPDLDGHLANKRDLLAHMLATEKGLVDPVMIGDRRYDMLGARDNGLSTVGVLYGYGSRGELESAGAERLVESPDEIPGALTE